MTLWVSLKISVDEYNHPGVIAVKVFNTWLYGISSFYRIGNLSISIVDNNAVIGKTKLTLNFPQRVNGFIHFRVTDWYSRIIRKNHMGGIAG